MVMPGVMAPEATFRSRTAPVGLAKARKLVLEDEVDVYRRDMKGQILYERGKPVPGNPRPIARKTVLNELTRLSAIFTWARTEYKMPALVNPIALIPKNKRPKGKARDRRLEPGELRRLIKAAEQDELPLIGPIIEFAVETACRRREITRIRLRDYDREMRTLKLRDTKNGEDRVIGLSSRARAILREHRTLRARQPLPSALAAQRWPRCCCCCCAVLRRGVTRVRRAGIACAILPREREHIHEALRQLAQALVPQPLAQRAPRMLSLSSGRILGGCQWRTALRRQGRQLLQHLAASRVATRGALRHRIPLQRRLVDGPRLAVHGTRLSSAEADVPGASVFLRLTRARRRATPAAPSKSAPRRCCQRLPARRRPRDAPTPLEFPFGLLFGQPALPARVQAPRSAAQG